MGGALDGHGWRDCDGHDGKNYLSVWRRRRAVRLIAPGCDRRQPWGGGGLQLRDRPIKEAKLYRKGKARHIYAQASSIKILMSSPKQKSQYRSWWLDVKLRCVTVKSKVLGQNWHLFRKIRRLRRAILCRLRRQGRGARCLLIGGVS